MKKNKLTINAFEKYELADKVKTLIYGGYPEGWTPPLEEELIDPVIDGGDDPDNSTGGPGSSTSTATGTIKFADVIVRP